MNDPLTPQPQPILVVLADGNGQIQIQCPFIHDMPAFSAMIADVLRAVSEQNAKKAQSRIVVPTAPAGNLRKLPPMNGASPSS